MVTARAKKGNGDGSVYQLHDATCPPVVDGVRPAHKCGKPWQAQVYVRDRTGKLTRKRATRPTRREAQEALRGLLREAGQGISRDQRYTLSGWVAEYLTIKADEVRATTVDEYSRTAKYISTTIGGLPVEQVTPADVRIMHRELRKRGLSGTTINHAHSLLRAALNAAVEERLIEWNPCSVVKAPKLSVEHFRQPSAAESAAILAAASGVRELARVAVAYLALRPAEVLALRWEDVHEDDAPPHLVVSGSMRQVKGQGLVRFEPKTKRSAAPLPLTRLAVESLRMWRLESGGVGYVFSQPGRPDTPSRSEQDLRWWHGLLARAGVPADINRYGVRGAVASSLDQAGASPRLIADTLRHARVSTTMEHYAQTIEPQLLAALESVIAERVSPDAPRALGGREED